MLIGSPIRSYQLALDDRRTLPLSPQRGSEKHKTADLRKNRTSLEESLLQSFFV